jgi:hypothetical protein
MAARWRERFLPAAARGNSIVPSADERTERGDYLDLFLGKRGSQIRRQTIVLYPRDDRRDECARAPLRVRGAAHFTAIRHVTMDVGRAWIRLRSPIRPP